MKSYKYRKPNTILFIFFHIVKFARITEQIVIWHHMNSVRRQSNPTTVYLFCWKPWIVGDFVQQDAKWKRIESLKNPFPNYVKKHHLWKADDGNLGLYPPRHLLLQHLPQPNCLILLPWSLPIILSMDPFVHPSQEEVLVY